MNLNKRFVLITTMAVVVFAAIAFVPRFTHIVHKVRATGGTVDTVLLVCDYNSAKPAGSQILIFSIESSNPGVTLPAVGSSCAAGLASIQEQGFVTPPNAADAAYPTSNAIIGSITSNPYPLWTLFRFTPPT